MPGEKQATSRCSLTMISSLSSISVEEKSLVPMLVANHKRSSAEFALAEAHISFQRDMKRLRVQLQTVESERDAIAATCHAVRTRLAEAETVAENAKQSAEMASLEATDRVDRILKCCREDASLNEQIADLQATLSRMRSELQSARDNADDLRLEIENAKQARDVSEKKLDELQHWHDEQKENLAEVSSLRAEILVLNSKIANLKSQLELACHGPGNSSSLISRPDGSGLVRSSSILHTTRLEQRVSALESENTELRARQADMRIVEDEVAVLRSRLARADEWRERALLAEEKLDSAACVTNSNAVDQEVNLNSSLIGRLQCENELLLADQGRLRSQLHKTEADLSLAKVECDSLSCEVDQLKASLQCLDKLTQIQKRKIKILRQERDMYKRFVDSYDDADATLASPSGELVIQFQEMVHSLSNSLEVFNANYEADSEELNQLKTRVSALVAKPAVTVTSFMQSDVTTSMEELRQKIIDLEAANQLLVSANEEKTFELEAMRSRGAFNPDQTRVVHLISNPADKAAKNIHDEAASLRKENAVLCQRVKILQERLTRLYDNKLTSKSSEVSTANDLGDITMAVEERLKDHPDPIFELNKLKSKLQAEKFRGDRMMEAFSSASAELRKAVGLLFGYNLSIRDPCTYKVSLYGSPTISQEHLIFKVVNNELRLDKSTMIMHDYELSQALDTNQLHAPTLLARLLLTKSEKPEQSTMLM